MKNYFKWSKLCEKIDTKEIDFFFREKEVWWCHLGENIGHEENGKHEKFERPVLILKKINKNLFVGVPLTTKYKCELYKIPIGIISGKRAYTLIEQFRVLSSKRLSVKIGATNQKTLKCIKAIIKELL